MKKRVLSIIICLMLVVGILPTGTVFAKASTRNVTSYTELTLALSDAGVSDILITANIEIPAQEYWTQLEITKNVVITQGNKLTVKAYDEGEILGVLFNDVLICDGGSITLETDAVIETEDIMSDPDMTFYRRSGRVCVVASGTLDASNGTVTSDSFINYNYGDECTDSKSLKLGSNTPKVEFSVNNEAQLRAAMQDNKCNAGIILEDDLVLTDSLSVSKYMIINDKTLTVNNGKVLTVTETGKLQSSGVINLFNHSTLTNKGEIDNLNIIDLFDSTFNNSGVVYGNCTGDNNGVPNYWSVLGIEGVSVINNFIGNKKGTINDCITVCEYIYKGDSSDNKCTWNTLDDSDTTFYQFFDDGSDNPNFDVVAVAFGKDLINYAFTLKNYWGENNKYSAPRYERVVACGTDYNNINTVEIGDVSVPSGITLLLKEFVFDGIHEYNNKYTVSNGKTLLLNKDSTLMCTGKSELNIAGNIDDMGANIDFGEFTVKGDAFVSNKTQLLNALSKGGEYHLLPFSDTENIGEDWLVIFDSPITVNKNTVLVYHGWNPFYIPGLNIAKGVTLAVDNMNIILADDGNIDGTLEMRNNSGITLRTPDEALDNETTTLTVTKNGKIYIEGGCWIGANSERWTIQNNGIIENFGSIDCSEGYYFGNEPIEYANLRDVVCELYNRFHNIEAFEEIDLETTNEWGIEDLHWVYEYPDGGNSMYNAENPEFSDFEGIAVFSWFIKNGIIPRYDIETSHELKPYDTIALSEISTLVNKLANKIADTENKTYFSYKGDNLIQRSRTLYLESEDRYSSELNELMNEIGSNMPKHIVKEEITYKINRYSDQDGNYFEVMDGYDTNVISNRHFTKPVIVECITELEDEGDNWGGNIFFENCQFDEDVIVIYNEEYNCGLDFTNSCSFGENANICVIKRDNAKVFGNARVNINNFAENVKVLALAPSNIYSNNKYYINGLPVIHGTCVDYDCDADHGEADYNEIDHNNCSITNHILRLDINEDCFSDIVENEYIDITAIVKRLNNNGQLQVSGTLVANELNNHCWYEEYENEEEGRYPHLVKGTINVGFYGELKLKNLNNDEYWEGEGEQARKVDEAEYNNNGASDINRNNPTHVITVSGKITSQGKETDAVMVELIKFFDTEPMFLLQTHGNNITYSFTDVASGVYRMRVTKNEHETVEFIVTVINCDIEKNITLKYLNGEKPMENPFKDIPKTSWYTEACLWCNMNGYITGTSSTTFAPSSKLTRAMFVQILAKVDGIDLNGIQYEGKFTDVKANNWYAKAVQWAVNNGVTGGTSATTFSPNNPVTREQLATFFMAYAKSRKYDTSATLSLSKYTDASKISSWALNAVKWAVAEGLISGTSATTISPKNTATRAQAAVIFKSFVQNYVSKQK